MIKRIIHYSIKEDGQGRKISDYLKMKNYPEAALTKLRHIEGCLSLNGSVVHMNECLSLGDDLSVSISENESSEKIIPIDLHFAIVYEDDDILVVNKPPFMPIHPSLNNYDNSLANAVAYYYKCKNEPYIFRCINRLDKDTSGLTILPKHFLSAGILSKELNERLIRREYLALAIKEEGATRLPDIGVIDKPIGRKDGSTIERFIDYQNGERAVTHFEVIKRFLIDDKEAVFVKCNLETGRTHQIRVHLLSMGYPLAGDFLYNPKDHTLNRQGLHAGRISFYHPITNEQMVFETMLPEDMKRVICD